MKINRILFPVDFSEHSQALCPEVEWLANYFQSQVTLLHVFEIPPTWSAPGEAPLITTAWYTDLADIAQKRLDAFEFHLPADRTERVVVEGDPAWQIEDWVHEHAIDLVVMGTHGYGTFRKLLLGSVAMKTLHDVPCPVWTHSALAVPPRILKSGISNIVCPIELTEETPALLRFTQELADEFRARVHLVHTVSDTGWKPYQYFGADSQQALKESAREQIAKLQQEAGTHFPFCITEGFIPQDIANVAVNQTADLIIIGRGKAQEPLGSLRTHAYDIIRRAPCPVLSFSTEWQERHPFSNIHELVEQSAH